MQVPVGTVGGGGGGGGEWQIPVPVGTGISTQQGMLSISETKRNHMGQGLGNTDTGVGGGGAEWQIPVPVGTGTARNAFNFGNKKKSHGARSGEYGGGGGGEGRGGGKTVTFSFFKNTVTIAEV